MRGCGSGAAKTMERARTRIASFIIGTPSWIDLTGSASSSNTKKVDEICPQVHLFHTNKYQVMILVTNVTSRLGNLPTVTAFDRPSTLARTLPMLNKTREIRLKALSFKRLVG